jgi:hypothetical protein
MAGMAAGPPPALVLHKARRLSCAGAGLPFMLRGDEPGSVWRRHAPLQALGDGAAEVRVAADVYRGGWRWGPARPEPHVGAPRTKSPLTCKLE